MTSIVAFAALIVSALTLWFTAIKGPDIVLCKKPRFTQDIGGPIDRIIPDTIIYTTNLFFLNNGTVSGVLGLEADFRPVEKMKPFFKKAHFRFATEPNRYTSYSSMQPISIGDKESRVVYVQLTVEFHDWKKHFVQDPVPKERIQEVLCQADSENKQRFSHFCGVLREGMHIGMVNIRSYQTTGWRFGTKDKERIIVDDEHIGVLDEKLIRDFRSWETRWNSIEPSTILTELRQVRKYFEEELCTRLEQNLKRLMGLIEIGSLETDLLDRVRRKPDGYEARSAIVDFILRSAGLDTRLKKYDLRTREWNRKIDLSREESSNRTLEQALIAEISSLEKETGELLAEIANLLNTLQKCYVPGP
jgi:hypothetical protein